MKSKRLSILPALISAVLSGSAAAAVYQQDFTYADGTTDLGDGSVLTAASTDTASIQGNALELTNEAASNAQNSFNIPALADSSLGFTVSFDVTFINPIADGFSFNYGTFDLTDNYGEAGTGGGLTWIIDTWENGSDRGVRTVVNGTQDFFSPFDAFQADSTLNLSIDLSWTPADGMSLSIDGLPAAYSFTNRPTPGFTGSDAYLFGFGARTGLFTETLLMDNLVITTVPEPSGVMLAGLAAMGVIGARRRRSA